MIKCWQCGKLNPENFNYCLECGAELQPEASHSAESDFLIEISADSPDEENSMQEIKVQKSEPVLKSRHEKDTLKPIKQSAPIELSPLDLEEDILNEKIDEEVGDDLVVFGEEEAGAILEPIAEEEPEPQPEKTAVAEVEVLHCAGCGARLDRGDRFCSNCGTPVGQVKPQTAGKTMFLNASGEMPATRKKTMARLTVIDNTGTDGMTYNIIEGENVCGSSDGLIIIEDKLVSAAHCSFSFENERLSVKDLDSVNGVYIKLRGEAEITSGTIFRIGQQLLIFKSAIDFEELIPPRNSETTAIQGSPLRGVWGKLIRINDKGKAGQHYLLRKETVVVGRENGDIYFPEDGFLSSSHIKLSRRENKYYMADLGSSNGTFIRIKQPTKLNNNDIILIGRVLMRVEYV